MPDIEQRFWRKYRDKGLVVVGLNPGGRGGIRGAASTDDIAGVQRFADNFRGSNPFPIDVIVDRDGTIAYVAREYDPEAMDAVIERLLAR